MQKVISACALMAILGLSATSAPAQHVAPYRPAAAEGQHHQESHGQYGPTFNQGGAFYGGAPQAGISYPSYNSYNRFSNLGFGGLNWYYGPLGGYTPYITTPYADASFGYPNFGPYYSYVPLAPVVRQPRSFYSQTIAFDAPPTQQPAAPRNGAANQNRGARAPEPQPVQANIKLFDKPTSPEALRKSIRYQAQGDEWFAKGNYLQAYDHYKQAMSAAPARTEPRFRKAMALAATTNYTQAVDEIKRAMRLDADWSAKGALLDELFGADNVLSKNAVLHKVARWVGDDIRDADRLFLIGVLLHFNSDSDQAHTFFEAAVELSPTPTYAQAFLDAEDGVRGGKLAEEPRPAPPEEGDTTPPAPAEGIVLPGKRGIPLRRSVPASKQPEEPKPRPLAASFRFRCPPRSQGTLQTAACGASA